MRLNLMEEFFFAISVGVLIYASRLVLDGVQTLKDRRSRCIMLQVCFEEDLECFESPEKWRGELEKEEQRIINNIVTDQNYFPVISVSEVTPGISLRDFRKEFTFLNRSVTKRVIRVINSYDDLLTFSKISQVASADRLNQQQKLDYVRCLYSLTRVYRDALKDAVEALRNEGFDHKSLLYFGLARK